MSQGITWNTLIVLAVIIINSGCNAIVCYKCDSVNVEACAMALDVAELPIVECNTSLQCVMSIVDSITYRGCATTTPTIDATYKKYCSENLCNKGVYPPGRLKCHHCSDGASCVAKPAGKPHPCRHHYETDQCFTEVISGVEAYRGCRSDTNHTLAAATVYCDYNGCNDKPAALSLKCAQCDSLAGRGCKMDLFEIGSANCNITEYTTCETTTLLTQSDSCYLYHNLSRVVRGCTKDMPEDLRQDVEHIVQCNGHDYCNARCMAQQRCIECDSADHDWCRSEDLQVAVNICGSAETSSCYACEYDNWQMQRGCGAPPRQELNVNRCFECGDKADCNAAPLTRCYKCSSQRNPNCANWNRPDFSIEIEECSQPSNLCVVAALSSGITMRGCQSDFLHCNDTLIGCQTCRGSFCNKGPFPPNRLHCHQCSGTADECLSPVADPLPCPLYAHIPVNDTEACFEYFNRQRGMVRGCRSNSAEYYECMLNSDVATCRLCYDHACNNSPATRKPALQCYQCIKSDPDCQRDQTVSGDLVFCQRPVPFGYSESCYITRHIDGSTSRGCTLDDYDAATGNPWDQTNYCAADACNSLATTALFCVSCEADLQLDVSSSCLTAPELLTPIKCSSSARGCFTLVAGSQIRRGCHEDDSCPNQSDSNCHFCNDQFCNAEHLLPSSRLALGRNDAELTSSSSSLNFIFILAACLTINKWCIDKK